jgi:hypothetical protein
MMRGFEPHRVQKLLDFKTTKTRLAQLVERQPFKLVVEGSSPSSGENKKHNGIAFFTQLCKNL